MNSSERHRPLAFFLLETPRSRLWQRLLFARCFQLRLDHEHVVLGQSTVVAALPDALGTLGAFHVLQRKKAKAFRVQNRTWLGKFTRLLRKESCFSVNACPDAGVPELELDARDFGLFLNNCSCWKKRLCKRMMI